jgi:hypothetical protein
MKILKVSLFVAISLISVAFLFRGFLYRQLVNYKSIEQRKTYAASNKALTDYIQEETTAFKPGNIKEIIKLSLKLTSQRLSYRKANNNIDPNNLIISKNAHCIGYSAFFTSTCNLLLRKYGLADKWNSRQLVGHIYFCGINIHTIFKSPFFKDHDFNIIENSETGEKYFVDPTLNDFLKINFVTSK